MSVILAEFEEAKDYGTSNQERSHKMHMHLTNVEFLRKDEGYKIGDISAAVAFATFSVSARVIDLRVEIKYALRLEKKLYQTGTHNHRQRAEFLREALLLLRAAWKNYGVI